MNDLNSDFEIDYDLFDPRTRARDDTPARAARGADGSPAGQTRRRLDSSGEYRPRHPSEKASAKASPSPAKEGGEDDFDVFNFDAARRRRQEKERLLNERIAAEESPRRFVQNIADNQTRQPVRSPERKAHAADDGTRRAADFVQKLSGYSERIPDRASADRPRRGAPSGKSTAQSDSRNGSVPPRNRQVPEGNGRAKQAESTAGSRRTKKRGSAIKKAVIAAAGVFLVLTVIYYAAFGIMLLGVNSLELTRREDTAASGVAAVELMDSSRVTNILLLGIDDDGGSGSRSDTIMLASLDARSNTIRLCSILRDCYVEIPGYGSNRINSAYAFGGAQLAVQTVENNFRVKIDHCVTIDMAALVDVVDAIGGVEIELTAAEAEQVNLHSHCGLTTGSGLQLLNGKQAVTYAQIRKIDSDFMRTQRQRTLINAILGRIRSLGVGELMSVVEAVAPNVTTDMSSSRIASLALKALPALSNELGQLTIPADGKYSVTTIKEMSVLKLDLEANVKLLQSYIYGE